MKTKKLTPLVYLFLISIFLSLDTVLKSVCMIKWEEWDRKRRILVPTIGTGFLAEVPGINKIAFLLPI